MKTFKNNRGSSMIGTLFLILIMGLAGASAMSLTTSGGNGTANEVNAVQAFYASQAGLDYAKKLILGGTNPNGLTKNFGLGSFTIAYDGARVTSNAQVGKAVKSHSIPVTMPAALQCGATVDAVSGRIYATGSPVRAEIWKNVNASYENNIILTAPGTPRTLGSNRDAGKLVDLGTFTAGQELIFKIQDVSTPSRQFFTGPASRNTDALVHAHVDSSHSDFIVSFEDQLGGGDMDFNDVQFRLLCTGGSSETFLSDGGNIAVNQMKYYQVSMAAGQTVIVRTASVQNVELLAGFGFQPTLTTNTLSAISPFGDETISYTAPTAGMLYIGVLGAQAGTYMMTASATDAGVYLNEGGRAVLNQMRYYAMNVPAGKTVFIRTSALLNKDLYMRVGALPTTTTYTAKAATASGDEVLVYTGTGAPIYIGVYGNEVSSYQLTVSDNFNYIPSY